MAGEGDTADKADTDDIAVIAMQTLTQHSPGNQEGSWQMRRRHGTGTGTAVPQETMFTPQCGKSTNTQLPPLLPPGILDLRSPCPVAHS